MFLEEIDLQDGSELSWLFSPCSSSIRAALSMDAVARDPLTTAGESSSGYWARLPPTVILAALFAGAVVRLARDPTGTRYNALMRPMTIDLDRSNVRPYFLWDEDLSIAELRERLAGPDPKERLRLLAKLLREARDIDVWKFVTPQEVAEALPAIVRRLGRRRRFWEFLIQGWREDGILTG